MLRNSDTSKSLKAARCVKSNRNFLFPKKNFRKSIADPSYVHEIGEQPLKYVTIGQLLEETANKFGDRKAIISVHQNESLTFSELLQKADKLAAAFKILNLE